MKILMLAPEPFFEPRGTPFAVLGRIKALSGLGHEVDLITYHIGKDVEIPRVKIYRTPILGFIKEVPVGPSRIKFLLDLLVLAKAFRMLLGTRYDLIHAHEEACVFGVLLAKIFGVRHLYDFHSSIPQAMRNFGYGQFTLLIRTLEWIERLTINGSDGVITISPALAGYVRKTNGNVPIAMIENIIEDLHQNTITEEKISAFKDTYSKLNGNKIVLYTGTFEPYQGIELFISSAKRVLQSRTDIIFVLVGGKAHQVEQFREQVSGLEISSHFYFTGIRPPEEMPLFMQSAHALVSPRIGGNNTPLKIYGYLRSGKPIIATRVEAHTQVLDDELAVLVDPQPDSMANGILTVLSNPSYAKKMGERAKNYFENHYSIETFVNRTQQILEMALR